MENINYLLRFNQLFDYIGPTRLKRLISVYGDIQKAWENLDETGLRKVGVEEGSINKIKDQRAKIKDINKAEIQSRGITPIDIEHKMYPKRLKDIYDPPYLLFVRGEILPEDEIAIGVVGSRKMTRYGEDVCKEFVSELASSGVTIVSGLALGIDACAHEAALSAGGRTIAVLASGVDKITPTANQQLADTIINSGRGAVISEFPLGKDPEPYYFPIRNRIISGICQGVLVIEAAEKSGALITASCAADQGREVYTVPGSIFSPMSFGTNQLAKKGAKVVISASEILEELDISLKIQNIEARKTLPETESEKRIVEVLDSGEKHMDEIAKALNISSSVVSSDLTLMEIKGIVKNIGAGVYRNA